MQTLFRQAWRSWKSAKGVALLAVLALAVGIGSAVAIYTVASAVLFKPLPFEQGERYVVLYAAQKSEPPDRMSSSTYRDLLTYKARAHSFDRFGWFAVLGDFNLTSPGQPQHIHGVEVTPSLVNGLGVKPVLGRWFSDRSQEPADLHTAVISEALWKRLGSDPRIAGKSIDLNGSSYTVTGVAPAWFRLVAMGVGPWLAPEDVWIPIDPHGAEQDDAHSIYLAYCRLRPGVTLAQASSELKALAVQIARESPAHHLPGYTARVRSLHELVASQIRPALLLLLGAAGLLLLITCANVSGLLVARSVQRAKETAIRVALGAGRTQLGLQFFFEGLLISAAGAVVGVPASYALVHSMLVLAPQYIPRADEVRIDWRVLLFAIAVACVSAILSSLAPLWQALRTQPNEALTEGVRASAGLRSRRLSHSLVVLEIALALTLLSAGTLLHGQLESLLHLWPGFEAKNLLTFQLQASNVQYSDEKTIAPYQRRILAGIEGIPGVESAALSSQLPLEGCCFNAPIISDDNRQQSRTLRAIDLNLVSSAYFRAMRIELVSGRFLNDHDSTEHPIHIVVNQSAVKQFWPSGSPVGATAHAGGEQGDQLQVVGVVKNVQNDQLDKAPAPEMYLLSTFGVVNPMHFVVRSRLAESSLVPKIRSVIRAIDPAQPIYDVVSMPEIVESSVTVQRGTSFLTNFFAAGSLLMAMLGVYGVLSYAVRQRTVEMGTRMAMGALPRNLMGLVLGNGWKLGAWGIALGAGGAGAAAWLLMNQYSLVNVQGSSFLYPVAIVGVVITMASFFPSWRATLLSPMVAIRDEQESVWHSTKRNVRSAMDTFSTPAPSSYDALLSAETTLLTEFVEAARRAESFEEALRAALTILCKQMKSESALLLEYNGADLYRCVSASPAPSSLSLPSRGFLLGRMRFYTLPFPISEEDLQTWLKWAELERPAHRAEIEQLRDVRARLAVPLRTRHEILAILLLGPKQGGEPYTSADKRILRACAEQLALMLENGRLNTRIVEQEKLRRDVALAVEVQKRLLPERFPETDIGELAAYTLPARSVGGDYYDFIQTGDHRIGIAVADVAGKGVAAALIMSVLQASLRILSSQGDISLPDLAANMNRFLHRSTGSSSYATFFYAQVDERTRELRYVNAGHNPPFLLRREPDSIEALTQGGMIIGMFPQAAYEEGTVQLRPGDVLIVFTDGVTEALNPGEEEFGEERLQMLLRSVSHLPVKEMSRHISEHLRDWIGTADQHDDLTFVVLKVE